MPTPSLVAPAAATGVKNYTLAFALGDSSGCNPAWGGTIPINDSRIVNDVRALQAQGGQVIVATGGAMGPYLEHVCGTSAALLTAYKRVLDTVGTNHLDVDVEAAIDANKVNTALKQLQAERGTVDQLHAAHPGPGLRGGPLLAVDPPGRRSQGPQRHGQPDADELRLHRQLGRRDDRRRQATLAQMRTVWPPRPTPSSKNCWASPR